MGGRLLIFGIDGVPYDVMEDFSDVGVMPNFKKLREKGGKFCKMLSSIPDISSVSWSTIISGTNPGEHGIFGFTDLIPGTYSLSFPNFATMKKQAFWEKEDGRKYFVMNVPSTYPAKPLNGCHVSGFVSLDLEKATYPEQFLEKLKQEGYRIDVDSELGHTNKDKFMQDLHDTLSIRTKVGMDLIESQWDVFFFVVTGSDRIGHFLQKAYADKEHPYHEKYKEFFRAIDEALGKFLDKLEPEDAVMMMSDHGMEPIKQNVYVNAFLQKEGFLQLEDENPRTYNSIKTSSTAFALDPGRIYIHTGGRYPNGQLGLEQKEEVIKKLIEAFEKLEFNGEKVIDKIYRKEDIYHGPETKTGPDLVLMSKRGFNLRGSIGKDTVFETDIFEGKHTYDDSFFFVHAPGKEIKIPENFCVEHVKGIIDQIMGEK